MSIPEFTAELCGDNGALGLRSAGMMVLSLSGRLLFIDRNAVDLLNKLDIDHDSWTGTGLLPSSLVTIVQEIATTHSATDSDRQSLLVGASHLLGERSQPIRVRTLLLSSQQHKRRIVLVLSQYDPEPRM